MMKFVVELDGDFEGMYNQVLEKLDPIKWPPEKLNRVLMQEGLMQLANRTGINAPQVEILEAGDAQVP